MEAVTRYTTYNVIPTQSIHSFEKSLNEINWKRMWAVVVTKEVFTYLKWCQYNLNICQHNNYFFNIRFIMQTLFKEVFALWFASSL